MAISYRTLPELSDNDILRFWSKVRIRGLDECWPWTAGTVGGYGSFCIFKKFSQSERHMFVSSRVAYLIHHGSVPDLHICHTCDNRKCCNPRHLFAGTVKDNSDDMIAKGRQVKAKGEGHGMSKLRDSDIKEIRQRFVKRDRKNGESALGREFRVSQTVISSIIRRRTWKHIP